MENRITTLFGIRYPVVAGGMVWCSGWRLAAAVSEAGGLGLIGSGSMTPELLREHIRKCRAASSRPFGVNVPLAYRYAPQLMDVITEERVPAVFTSAGNPVTWTARLHDAGCRVAHVVSSSKFALKSREAGVDAVVAEGFEAGGHNGREETTTMALVPQVRQAVDLPLRTTAEDFGFYTHLYPSLFYRLGVGAAAGRPHTATFFPDEAAIGVGIAYMRKLALQLLEK